MTVLFVYKLYICDALHLCVIMLNTLQKIIYLVRFRLMLLQVLEYSSVYLWGMRYKL